MTRLLALTICISLAAAEMAAGAWGPGCGPVGPTSQGSYHYVSQAPSLAAAHWSSQTGHFWVKSYLYPEQFYLYKDNAQVGAWTGKIFYPFTAATGYGPPCRPPWLPKGEVSEVERSWKTHGVNSEKIPDSPPFSVNGRQVTKDEALAAVSNIPADDKLPHVVVIGKPEILKTVQADWAALGDKTRGVLLHVFGQDASWVKAQGLELESNQKFQKSGLALLSVSPDGSTTHAQYEYRGPDDLLFAAGLDKVPDQRPGGGSSTLDGIVAWLQSNPLLAAALAVIGYLLFWRKDK